jgi:2,4-diketo-3-deoxy-L-fuconate hydrolase
MKLANLDGRAALLTDNGAVDVAEASEAKFGPSLPAIYDEWESFREWAGSVDHSAATTAALDETRLASPSPEPRQVFGIGINYKAHADEGGAQLPEIPATFTKFPASISGPFDNVELSGDTVDYEVELVVVIGARADRVAQADAWAHVAGLCIGQDISDRHVQFAAGAQFSLGKSFRGYSPMGPWLVTPDELADPDDLALGCSLNGETMQDARTSELIFTVPSLIEELSAVVPMLPGDVIFTGTPSGVGFTRQPPRMLRDGDVLESTIEGLGTMRNQIVGA